MAITIAELLKALPTEDADKSTISDERLDALRANIDSTSPVPTGRFQRFSLLGSLQAKLALAYGFHWLRGYFQNADSRQRDAAETHFKAAVKLLDSMCYMRGAVMKVGQILANFPNILPDELVSTLSKLHFEAPPMHFSLLRETIVNELGDEPEKIFAEFQEDAMAAASLGQVHRARLRTGEEVAVKLQYPGIGRTIRADFRNLAPLLLPGRLSKDWENFKQQFEFVRRGIELESNYEQEAANLERSRRVFFEEDSIVVPRVFKEYSTARVLTMEFLEGMHLEEYLATSPSQEDRNEFARKLIRAACRIMYRTQMIYVDWHPGNFLFMPDGRLGLIDFGCMLVYSSEAEWQTLGPLVNRAITTGRDEDARAALRYWANLSEGPENAEQVQAYADFSKWQWRPYFTPGPFNFGSIEYVQEGIELFSGVARRRYARGHESSFLNLRYVIGITMMLYRLGANIDITPIGEEEVLATGWDRSDFKPVM